MRRLVLIAFLFVASLSAWAGPALTTANVITELMMNDSSATATMMSLYFGPDFSSQVRFDSNVDALGIAFSFSSQPGSVYLGQNLQLSGSGVFDPSTGDASMSGAGMLGSTSWTTSGAFVVVGDATNGYTFTGDEGFFLGPGIGPGVLPPTRCVEFSFSGAKIGPNGQSLASGTWEDTCHPPHSGVWASADTYEKVDGGTKIRTTVLGYKEVYFVEDKGSSPPNGGSGSYVISYTALPEPGSFLLLASGICGAAAWRRSKFV
jgi:hypothetical protein